MDQSTKDMLTRNPAAQRAALLLHQTLPRVQPSAMKHEYLTSVANVMCHYVAEEEVVENGTTFAYRIGFGDMNRTLPLVIIVDKHDDTVIHAMPPRRNNQIEQRLVHKLQKHEDQWCAERGYTERRRNIVEELKHRPVDDVNRHGLSRYIPAPPFSYEDLKDIAGGRWYDTEYMRAHDEIKTRRNEEVDIVHDALHREIIEDNLTVSLNTATRPERQVGRKMKAAGKNPPPAVRIDDVQLSRHSTRTRMSIAHIAHRSDDYDGPEP